jgi:hypothetical protein
MRKQHKRIVIIISFCLGLFVLSILLFYLSEESYKRARLETEELGNKIIVMLDEYYNKKNRYPETLSELGDILQPTWGEEWVYTCKNQGTSCCLLVGFENEEYGGLKPVMGWDSKNQKWLYDE